MIKTTQSCVADGTVHMAKQQYEQAVECFRQAIKLDPHHVTAQMNLSNSLRKTGKLGQSIEVLKNAIQLNPNLPNLHSNLGCCYEKALKFQDAINQYNRALKLNKNLSDVHVRLGVILRTVKKDSFESLRHFQSAIQLDKCNIQALNNASEIYLQQGNKQKAESLNKVCMNQNCKNEMTVQICKRLSKE